MTNTQEHKDSQPKPASVEEIANKLSAAANLVANEEADLLNDAAQLITQQAEALAQAQDDADDLHHANNMREKAEQERDQLRDQLAALQYDGELPEPVAWLAEYGGDVYTADQVRQAIANDRAKQVPNEETHLINLRNAVNIFQSFVNGNTSFEFAQMSINALNSYIDAAAQDPKEQL